MTTTHAIGCDWLGCTARREQDRDAEGWTHLAAGTYEPYERRDFDLCPAHSRMLWRTLGPVVAR